MGTIYWILIFGLLMSFIALAGCLLLFLQPNVLDAIILPLVAFAAGSLIGGALFHMIPHAIEKMGNETEVYVLLVAGFAIFLGLEQFLNWHHSHTHSHTCGPFSPPHQHGVCPCPIVRPSGTTFQEVSHTHVGGLDVCTIIAEEDDTAGPSTMAELQVSPSTCTCNLSNISSQENRTIDEEALFYVDDNNQHCETISTEMQPNGEQLPCHVGDRIVDSGPAERPGSPHTASKTQHPKQSLGYLILIADAVHNFIGGLFVGASFVDSTKLGLSAWASAAAHELPQELGDFAILVHAGWSHSGALVFNFFSALTFPLGAIIAYISSKSVDVTFLIPFAAGNFLYIGATDLIPEVKHCHGMKQDAVNYASFLAGVVFLLSIRIIFDGW